MADSNLASTSTSDAPRQVDRMANPTTALVLGKPTAFRTLVQHWLHEARLDVRTAQRMADVPEFKAGFASTGTPWLVNLVIAVPEATTRSIDPNELRRLCTAATPPVPVIVLVDTDSGAAPATAGAGWRELSKPIHGETLLRAVADALPNHPATSLKYSGHGLLVAEDSLLLENARQAIEDLGLDASESPTLREACDLLQQVKFDWVLADVRTPTSIGWALLKFIQAFRLSVPLVFGVGSDAGAKALPPAGYTQAAAAEQVPVVEWNAPAQWLSTLQSTAATSGLTLRRSEPSPQNSSAPSAGGLS